jgi:hypothetical protein
MAFINIVAMYDDPAALQRAKGRLKCEGLATEATMRIEQEELVEDLHPPKARGVWERLKGLFGLSGEEAGYYAEGVRRGSQLLVVTVEEQDADRVRQVLRETGAVDIRRRVKRWISTGWQGFDPAGIAVTAEEMIEERRQRIAEEEIGHAERDRSDSPDRKIRLFDEGTGRAIGRISEDELRVLREAFEEEDPEDRDYWINPDEIEDLRCRPGATPHLIALLYAAVEDRKDGIDVEYQREGEARQRLHEAERTAHR